MKTLSSDKRIERIAADSAFVCAALALSYIEAVFPVAALIPLPGFKLGLANIAITAAAYRYSAKDAAAVSLCRIVISFLLFGNGASLFFSLSGASLTCAGLAFLTCGKLAEKINSKLSFIGISIVCALLHNLGQLIAAVILVGYAVLSYLPFLLAASLIYGSVCGIILCLLPDKIYKKIL